MNPKSYTLFSVTKEDRALRSSRIREMYAKEPLIAFLLAAFDFEWTARRAIVAMSPCPTRKIHEAFGECKVVGWPAYKAMWRQLVGRLRTDVASSFGVVLETAARNDGLPESHYVNLNNVLKIRHKLVHGIRGNARADRVDYGFNLLLQASEAITDYVDTHSNRRMYSRIVRRAACKRCVLENCPIKRALEKRMLRKSKAKGVKL